MGVLPGMALFIRDMASGGFEYKQIISLIPGIVCLIVAKLTKEAIGYGDAMIIFMLGLYWRWESVCTVLMGACMLAAIFALVLLIFFRKNRKYEIPFVPFLALALFMEEIWI